MQNDEKEIRELVKSWFDATRKGDYETVLDLMTEDVVFLVPGQAPFGKSAFAETSKQHAGSAIQFDARSEIHEIRVAGRLGIHAHPVIRYDNAAGPGQACRPEWSHPVGPSQTSRQVADRARRQFAGEARRLIAEMPIRIVRLGSPRSANEGVRIGTVRRPPRGVPKSKFASDDWYDVWFPNLAPSVETLKIGQRAKTPAQWSAFIRKLPLRNGDARESAGPLHCSRHSRMNATFQSAATARTNRAVIARCCENCLPQAVRACHQGAEDNRITTRPIAAEPAPMDFPVGKVILRARSGGNLTPNLGGSLS